jgi:hypothetical protein
MLQATKYRFQFFLLQTLLFQVLLLFANLAFGNEPLRLRSESELLDSPPQSFVRVKSAKVAWANYQAIKRDFKELRDWPEAQIDDWILNNFAFISENQLKLVGIRSTEIETTGETRSFFVPEHYNRAAIAAAHLDGNTIGLVDLKGSGLTDSYHLMSQVREFNYLQKAIAEAQRRSDNLALAIYRKQIQELHTKDHSDGLMSLGEAIAEISRQLAVQIGFNVQSRQATDKNHIHRETVENYFIVSYGFNILKARSLSIPAGFIGRQAHLRGDLVPPTDIYSDPYGGRQGSVSESSVDFGGVIVTFPELVNRFGTLQKNGRNDDPQYSKPWMWGHDTANFYMSHLQNEPAKARDAITKHLQVDMISPFTMQDHLSKKYTEEDLVKYLQSPSKKARDVEASRIQAYLANQENDSASKQRLISRIGGLILNYLNPAIEPNSAQLLWLLSSLKKAQLMQNEAIRAKISDLLTSPLLSGLDAYEAIIYLKSNNYFSKDANSAKLLMTLFAQTSLPICLDTVESLGLMNEPIGISEIAKALNFPKLAPTSRLYRWETVMQFVERLSLWKNPEIQDAIAATLVSPQAEQILKDSEFQDLAANNPALAALVKYNKFNQSPSKNKQLQCHLLFIE